MSKDLRPYIVISIIPLIYGCLAILFKMATGPFWFATNFDPAYLYLINGLHILKGVHVNDATHPGTPLQMLCGTVCWLLNAGKPFDQIATCVFKNPEPYLHIVYAMLLLLSVASLIGLSVYVYSQTKDLIAAVVLQVPILNFCLVKSWEATMPVLPIAANVSPEPFMVGMANLFNLCLFMSFWARSPRQELRACVLWAMMAGLGTAVKLTFAPLLLTALIVLSWRRKIIFLGVCMLTFFICTIPALYKYPQEASWIISFVTHRGTFFHGDPSGTETKFVILSNFMRIVLQYWPLGVLLAFSLGLSLWQGIRKNWSKASWYLLGTIMGVLFQWLVVAKNPGAHYLVPSLGVSAALVVLFYLQIRPWHRLIPLITLGLILVVGIVEICMVGRYLSQESAWMQGMRQFDQRVRQQYQSCAVIHYYRSSDPGFALFFGDGWNGEFQLKNELNQVYPQSLIFSRGGSDTISSFDNRVFSNDLLAQSPCVLFRGSRDFDFNGWPFSVKLMDQGNYENVYLLTGSTEKQAAVLLEASMEMVQAGKMDEALGLALKAREYHYQPDGAVSSLIDFIQTHRP